MKKNYFLYVCLFFILNVKTVTCKKPNKPSKELLTKYSSDILEDMDLDTEELIRKYKYPVEVHYVCTKDGYILRLHRIARPSAKPFFLQHGMLDSSATFVFMGPSKGLGYYLYDMGYDVWMGNARGNRYSRNHTTLNPDDNVKFWNFSWHEIGVYDLPAMIDFILNLTKYEKLYYVGHSQGTTAFWVMCSMLPDYNSKIELMHALAPVAYMSHVKNPFTDMAINIVKSPISYTIPELLPRSQHYISLCISNDQMKTVCIETLYLLFGKNAAQFNVTMLPVILGHIPAGIAMKQLRHYLQLVQSARFCQYDYYTRNEIVYNNNTEPPDYPLENIVAPVILYYSQNDLLTTDTDIFIMADKLGKLVEKVEVPLPLWNHIDFVWGIDAKEVIFDKILYKTKSFKSI